MSRRTENDPPIETKAQEAPEHRSPSTAEHPVTREPGDLDPSNPNPPAPPTPRAPSASDAGFGSFG
ncbi:fibronectin-attachment protein (FAP) [Methylobacterium sp. J-077]|uniref:fibronectin-attachment protein (FAP) n=1 Tax=Methylobacterium sp. J-077 TaxID=2836656 RepID=UPI001FB8F89A|nr:fibronectin-attachment protein (FAP) [Methylobacterium sp. J-077]MCJ2122228.1 fibronectin-attachment protein (FAP) [Methylobacterium sp. J-077]